MFSSQEHEVKDFNNEYFFVLYPREDDKIINVLPHLSPDDDTAKLPYESSVLPVGHKPLVFENGAADFNAKHSRTSIKQPPEVLFSGNYPLVSGRLRESLLKFELPNVSLQPAIFVDEWGTWHEDYWFLTFTSFFDCWDRPTSDYDPSSQPISIGGDVMHNVYRFSLNNDLLNNTPLRDRLLFMMGGSLDAYVVAHQSIAGLFTKAGGSHVIPIPDFPDKW
jgi:hypothetical protein